MNHAQEGFELQEFHLFPQAFSKRSLASNIFY